eukprot:6889645-Lingulodinium_polyedra.AAC.1
MPINNGGQDSRLRPARQPRGEPRCSHVPVGVFHWRREVEMSTPFVNAASTSATSRLTLPV